MNIPADIRDQLAQIPDGFTVALGVTENGTALAWYGEGDYAGYAFGAVFPTKQPTEAQVALMHDAIRRRVWEIMELLRLNRPDLVEIYRTDYHGRRPGRGRPMTAEAKELLRNIKAAHDARTALDANDPSPAS